MAKRILIADDSVTIQKAFAMTFAGADDVTVSGARNADEGLALALTAKQSASSSWWSPACMIVKSDCADTGGDPLRILPVA